MNIRLKKSTACIVLAAMLVELLTPVASYALTSGPSQPEMQSFEPVGTTDMVNAFSGDFTYNIPLLDVEGYPVNIAYHSGVNLEQEASWVGLGWNINPGNINHGVRGLPDDFNGEKIVKDIQINDEITKRFGMFFSLEFAGLELSKAASGVAKMLKMNMGMQVNMGINVSNYTGVSASISSGTNVGMSNSWISAGVNMGATFSTDNGADLDAGITASANSKSSNAMTTTVTGSFGKAYNSREGLKYTSFGVSPSFSYHQKYNSAANGDEPKESTVAANNRPEGVSNTVVPISMQNYVPVITNASFMTSNFYQFKLGIEASATVYPHFGGSYGEDKLQFENDGTRAAYGYFNLQNATKDDIADFTRDRDGRFNRDMQYLPSGNMTYDIYGVSGQGTAGNFRSFRNDIGTVYDPYTNSDRKAQNDLVELGVGNIFEAGWDHVSNFTSSSSGPWSKFKNGFSSKKAGSLYEPHYFKQAGELTEASSEFNSAIKGAKPLTTAEVRALQASPLESGTVSDFSTRARRSNLLYYFTAAEASNPGVSLNPSIRNYSTPGDMNNSPISRVDNNYRKAYHASEFTQLLPDGKRYIYGIPAMNKEQNEYVVSCNPSSSNDGTVDISTSGQNLMPYGGNAAGQPNFGQKFFMKTATPAYAHSYLLTEILSTDYSDLTGDGISDDDLGSYTRFNYSLKDANYRWRTPYRTGMAQYDRGVASDCHDDKATFINGSKEIWMLHSIETKNYVAEFYISPREDAKGATDAIGLSNNAVSGGVSYKLDKIVLYNKMDRKSNGAGAVPIKTVLFTYDYSLCQGTHNATTGKLTLKAISIKFGNSDVGLLSPYRFSYDSNPNYEAGAKDMWGNYKANSANGNRSIGLSNHDFPYLNQDRQSADVYASAWNLSIIKLPSGGSIKVSYEADDYAYVQDRRSMEMFNVAGIGATPAFSAGNSLYQNPTSPYLYVYFLRKKNNNSFEEWYNDVRKAYLDNGDLLQYNFKVKMSSTGETTPSCGIPLEDHVKGYAGVDTMGICSDDRYAFVKLSPKNVEKMPSLSSLGVSNLNLNPVTLTAIFYARYYNSKALYPSSEIVSTQDAGALIKQLLASFMEISNYFRSPITKYLNEGRAKYVVLDQSYVRLCSQGKKAGGGHRVKRIEFTDNWDKVSSPGQPVAVYGSDYDYTVVDEASGKRISSGVATYEPLYGGDENPLKEPIATDRIGQKRDFPVVIPTELTVEGPIGESMYPSADVGYSKVTVTSIHKSEGASSQTIQEHEFYTARDFPIRTANTPLEKLEDKRIKAFDLALNKKESYRVGQGYSLFFNDMHGKSKMESVWVAKPGDARQLVSYKKYEYFTNTDRTLKNDVPCAYFDANNNLQQGAKTLGVETDVMLDSREKKEETRTKGFMANLNVFMGPAFPIPIPSAFPKFPKSVEKTFSSIVSTKVIQQYGILKAVETFDKGAAVKLSNETFDPTTGLPLVTKVNTEYKDNEFQVKYPAYWAYRCMGPAYKNILYEEKIADNAAIVADSFYLNTPYPDRFNVGDELLFSLDNSCVQGKNESPQTYKLWVADKRATTPVIPELSDCNCVLKSGMAVSYFAHHNCNSTSGHSRKSADAPARFAPVMVRNAQGNLVIEQVRDQNGNLVDHYIPADNVCNLDYESMLDYSTGANSLKELLQPSGPQKFPELSNLLFPNNVNNKYPVEAMNFYWGGANGDYRDYPSKTDNPYVIFQQDTIFLNGMSSPWTHYGFKGGETKIKGVIRNGDISYYQNKFPNRPVINVANQLVKISVKISTRTRTFVWNNNPSQAVYAFSLQDYHDPQGIDNLYHQCVYDIYIPYDGAFSANITSQEISSLNKNEVLWSTQDLPYGFGRKTRRSLWYYFQLKLRDLAIANNPQSPQATSQPTDISWLPVTISGQTYNSSFDRKEWFYSSTATIINRSSIDGQNPNASIVALPRTREAQPTVGNMAKTFPKNDRIYEGSVKVIRSGRRNQLQETVQDVAIVDRSNTAFSYNNSMASYKVLQASAQTFTDNAAASKSIAEPATPYYNPFVTGRRGNYRLLAKYNINQARDYSASIDPGKGILTAVNSFWKQNLLPDNYTASIIPDVSVLGKWFPQSWVKMYSPWGNDLEVQDAAGNIQATIFGYGNTLPVATIKNGQWDNVLYENFEDKAVPGTILNFYQNDLGKFLQTASGVAFTSVDHHTGGYALNILSGVTTSLPVNSATPSTFPAGGLYPFHFRPGKKYVVSYWQKAEQNSFNTGLPGKLNLYTGTVQNLFYPRTPVIDGWVMYEREVSIPPTLDGGAVTVNLAPGVIDDVRILPVEANMKCYVYHPVTRKLVGILDENHMSSFFEYDVEGKLVRIKKETEKGILTLKESRGSLHNVLNTANGNGSINLTQ